MTVLIQELSSTVVSAVNNWTFALAEWTVLPRKGLFKTALDKNPYLKEWVLGFAQRKQADERVRRGFYVEDPDEDMMPPRATTEQCRQEALERLAGDYGDAEHDLARQLALAIKSVAGDLRATPPKRYLYEQWVHFTKLIRFSRRTREEVEQIEEEEGLVEWDWIGEDSPMLADVTEAEWVLDRLCESLNRYTKRQAVQVCALISMVRDGNADGRGSTPHSREETRLQSRPTIMITMMILEKEKKAKTRMRMRMRLRERGNHLPHRLAKNKSLMSPHTKKDMQYRNPLVQCR